MGTISIAMATYNGESYLREQIDSILNQTVQFDEFVICDDSSTDGTWEIITDYCNRDSRIKTYKNSHNIGFLRNFERALRLCTGRYIALSDQDDIWLPNHLEVLLNGIGDKAISVGDAEIINEAGIRTGKLLSYCTNMDYIPNEDIGKAYHIFFYACHYYGMAMLINKRILNKALPIPSCFKYHDMWLACLACFSGGIQYVDTPVTLYRRLDSSISGPKKRTSKIRTIVGHLLFNRALNDRPLFVKEIRDRLGNSLDEEGKIFLDIASLYYSRRSALTGRIKNFIFEMKHYKLIYGYKKL